jgi:hypothetical protein
MIGNHLARSLGAKRSLLALLASSALFTAGRANMATTATGSDPVSSALTIGGKLHGGSQPINGATIKLYYVGEGTAAIEAATTTTDSTGAFSFTKSASVGGSENGSTYSCPGGSSDPLVYVIAKGGNTLNNGVTMAVNSAAAFMGVYGTCNEISSANYITMNEVTTVGTMLAVQQYFDPATESLSGDSTGAANDAILNLPATIANLVNSATGAVVTSTTINGAASHGLGSVTVTATPESTKINMLANILTSCVNNVSVTTGNCGTLFASAVPPTPATTNLPAETFGTPTDVLQALFYMLTNPTSGSLANRTALFGLASGAGAPFQPALATQPVDWTVAINYTSSSTCGTGSGALISGPNNVAVDLFGDIWLANSQSNSLVAITAGGVAEACATVASGTTPANGGLFIDSQGNIWSALSGSATLTRYNQATQATLTYTAAAPVVAIAGDGNGNIFFSTASNIYQIVGGASAILATTPTVWAAVPNVAALMPDASETSTIWASSGNGSLQQIVGGVINPLTATPNTQGIAVTGTSNVFVSSTTSSGVGNISYFAKPATPPLTYTLQNGWPTAASTAGITQPAAIALDGASNVWIANSAANTNSLFAISEISAAGSPLSPDTASGGFQKSSSYLNASSNLIVDQSGNVWIVGGSNNFVTEIVGAGVPIYQPYAQGLANSRFQGKP